MPTEKRVPRSCQQRHHSFPSDEPGAVCLGCGKKRGERAARTLGAGGVQGLRAVLGIGAPLPVNGAPEKQQPEPAAVEPATSPPPAAAPLELEPTRKRPSKVLWPRIAHRGTQLFEGLVEWANERRGRRANEPEPEDRQEFEDALAAELEIWFPDVAAGPTTRLLVAGGFLAMGMSWNAEKIAPEPRPVQSAPPPAPPAAEGEKAPEPSAAPDAATEHERALLRVLSS